MIPDPIWPEPMSPTGGKPAKLDAESVKAGCALLAESAPTLGAIPTAERAALLGRVASCWLDPDYRYRVEARERLQATTGFSFAVVDAGLEALFRAWTSDALIRLLEGSGLAAGQSPAESANRWVRAEYGVATYPGRHRLMALPPRLVGHILSANVPPPVVQTLFPALLVGAPSFLKAPSSEPWFATLLVRSLKAEAPELARSVAVATWPAGADRLSEGLFHTAELVVVFGSDQTVQTIRSRLPAKTRLIGHPHRFSAGYVARETLVPANLPALARAFARDVALFDQQGCLSPQVIFVETGGASPVDAFVRELAHRALPEVGKALPPRRLGLDEGAALVQFKGVRALDGAVFPVPGGAVAVTRASRFVAPGPGRTLLVKPVDHVDQALSYLGDAVRSLQAVAVATVAARGGTIERSFAHAGASRICRPGRLQSPPAIWPGDGFRPLEALLRWVLIDDENTDGSSPA